MKTNPGQAEFTTKRYMYILEEDLPYEITLFNKF